MICEKCKQIISEQLSRQQEALRQVQAQMSFLQGTVAVLEALLNTDTGESDNDKQEDKIQD